MNSTNLTGPTSHSMFSTLAQCHHLRYNGMGIKMGIDIDEIATSINFGLIY
jgi:hypothetical protein